MNMDQVMAFYIFVSMMVFVCFSVDWLLGLIGLFTNRRALHGPTVSDK